ncbi:MAG: citrate synthase family protein [Myxococcota bacterium]|nr:citrate synthase family protein [Myxococcota bacterium]
MNQSKGDRPDVESGGLEEELSARQAAEILGVKLATLYAYVSRGLLRSTPTGSGRARRYLRGDVEALRRSRRGAGDAQGALRWGEPLLETRITEMTPEGPRYCGRLAVELARDGVPFESVAELLWTGSLPSAAPRFDSPTWPDTDALVRLAAGETAHTAWAALVVAALAARDRGRHDRRPEAIARRGRGLVRALAATLAFSHDPGRVGEALAAERVAESVAISLGVRPRRAAIRAIDSVLVLMADHELNASTFAARVSASTGADVYACIQSGLATLSGPLHGAASDHVEALLAEVPRPEDAERVVLERDRRGEPLPGFGHPFYRGTGDPRVEPILDAAFEAHERSAALRRLAAVAEVMERAGRPRPNVDFAIVGLRAALGMPKGAGAGLFVVGRSAGWIAHILEQARDGSLIRPRARYRAPGPAPERAEDAP